MERRREEGGGRLINSVLIINCSQPEPPLDFQVYSPQFFIDVEV